MADKYTQTLSFKADLSQLVSELQRMPDAAGKEAKAMVANLSREFKKVEKTTARAAKQSGRAWSKNAKGMKTMADSVDRADTALKQLAGGIGRISPTTELAMMSLGDMAGTASMMMNPLGAAVGAMAALTAGVAVMAGGLVAATFKADDFLEELKDLKGVKGFIPEIPAEEMEALENVNASMTAIKKTAMVAAVVIGTKFAPVLEPLAVGLLTAAIASKNLLKSIDGVRAKMQEALGPVSKFFQIAGPGIAALSGNIPMLAVHTVAKLAGKTAAASKEFGSAQEEASSLLDELKRLSKEGDNNAGSFKKTTDEIDKLISATDRMLPKEQIGKVQELTRQLETLQTAAQQSAENAGRLAPSIAAVGDAIDTLQAQEVAQEVAALVEEANKLAPPATLSRMQQLVTLQGQLSQAMQSGAGDAGATSDAHARATTAIADEWAALEQSLTSAAQGAANSIAGAAQQMGDHWKEVLRRITNLVQTTFSNATQAASNFAQIGLDNAMKYGEEELEIRGENIAELEAQLQEAMNARADIEREASGITAEQERAQTAGRVEEIRKRLAEEKRAQAIIEAQKNAAIVKAFNIQQAARTAEAIMNTAAAVTLAAAFVPAPLNAPLIASMVALGASQVALIASQEPPTMHTGGMIGPDEAMIKARRGEGVLTQQGVAAIGGPAGLDAANRGQGSGGQVIQMVYKHKVLDEVVSDSIRRGGPIQRAINRRSPRGRRNPHGRRTG